MGEFLTRCHWIPLTQQRVMNTFIMYISINGCTEQFKNRRYVIIPVESSWHHVVVNKLPFPPKVHWTVQLQDKIMLIFITLLGGRHWEWAAQQSSHHIETTLKNRFRIIEYFRLNVNSLRSYLAVVTVRQYPVLLCRVEEQAQDMEVNGMLLKACPFIWTDENSALYLWVAKYHYLKYREQGEGYGIRRGGETEIPSFGINLIKKNATWCEACKRSDGKIKATEKCWPSVCW